MERMSQRDMQKEEAKRETNGAAERDSRKSPNDLVIYSEAKSCFLVTPTEILLLSSLMLFLSLSAVPLQRNDRPSETH